MKVVLDTNVLMSAIFWGGAPLKVFRLVLEESLTACVTETIAAEYSETVIHLRKK